MKKVTVFGSSKNDLDPFYFQQTERLMNLLDPDQFTLVYGGGNKGLMALTRKFKGKVVSSNLYKFVPDDTEFVKDDFLFDTIEERQSKMMELGDMYLILPGGYGTHYEMLEVITKNDIGQTKKPIFIFNLNHVFDTLIIHLHDLYQKGFITRDLFSLHVYNISEPESLAEIMNQIDLPLL